MAAIFFVLPAKFYAGDKIGGRYMNISGFGIHLFNGTQQVLVDHNSIVGGICAGAAGHRLCLFY